MVEKLCEDLKKENKFFMENCWENASKILSENYIKNFNHIKLIENIENIEENIIPI